MLRRIPALGIAALLIALLCGGTPARAQSPFMGGWSGSWADKGLSQSGKAAMTIDAGGRIIDGTVGNSTFAASSRLAGTVQDNGAGTFTYSYDGGRTVYRGSGRFSLKGAEMVGEVDFILPNGTIFGHGRFTFIRDAMPVAPNRPAPAGPAAPHLSKPPGNAAVSAQS